MTEEKEKVWCPCCLKKRPEEGHQCPYCKCNTPPLEYDPAPHLEQSKENIKEIKPFK